MLLLNNEATALEFDDTQNAEDSSNVEIRGVSSNVYHGLPGESSLELSLRILRTEILHEESAKEAVIKNRPERLYL